MGWGDFFERDVDVKQAKTLTPEQERLLNAMLGQSQEYMPETYRMLAQFMRGDTGLTPEAIEQFYQQGVLQPALQEYEQYVRPQIEEQFGSRYHSSARTGALSRAFSDLMTQMGQTRANLQYQGLLQNIGLRQWGASGLMGMIQQPLNVKAFENIAVQQASPFDIVTQLAGTAGTVAAWFGMLGGGSTGGASLPRR